MFVLRIFSTSMPQYNVNIIINVEVTVTRQYDSNRRVSTPTAWSTMWPAVIDDMSKLFLSLLLSAEQSAFA